MTAVVLVLVLGLSTTFWSVVGLGRAFDGWRRRSGRRQLTARYGPASIDSATPIGPADVAVLVAAHNEELVIAETIRAASSLVDPASIHIISDGSTDTTAEVARAAGAQVLELNPNRGKAGALAAGIDHFELSKNYQVVLLLDADTHLAHDYLTTGLPLFADPDVVAVAGRAMSIEESSAVSRFGRFLIAYRQRLYLIVQLMIKFGQAAKWANAVSIVPGFASMYRTSILAQIDVVGAGLVIEDFNMTFEIHAKRLGRIEFHPSAAIAYTQDPDTLKDYVKQVRRWILGFWQTVRRHRLQVGVFWVALAIFIVELISSSVLFVVMIPLLLASMVAGIVRATDANAANWVGWLADLLQPSDVLIGVLLPDLLLTLIAVFALRRPKYLLYFWAFPLMRIVDAALCLRCLPAAWLSKSNGVWASPTRRPNAFGARSGSSFTAMGEQQSQGSIPLEIGALAAADAANG